MSVTSQKRPAPIAVFGYKRPELLRRALESLAANDLARQSDVTIFIDGPKNDKEVERVEHCRGEARRAKGFRSRSLVFREENIGLRRSVISGIDSILQQSTRVIVIEDDLILSPFFLSFINDGLERYRQSPNVFSLSGFTFHPDYLTIPPSYPYDVWANYRFSCWGWATWADRWKRVDWEIADYRDFITDADAVQRYARAGRDIVPMLKSATEHPTDDWALRFQQAQLRADGLCIQPRHTLVENHGEGKDASHCTTIHPLYRSRIRPDWQPRVFPSPVETDDEIIARYDSMTRFLSPDRDRFVILRCCGQLLHRYVWPKSPVWKP